LGGRSTVKRGTAKSNDRGMKGFRDKNLYFKVQRGGMVGTL